MEIDPKWRATISQSAAHGVEPLDTGLFKSPKCETQRAFFMGLEKWGVCATPWLKQHTWEPQQWKRSWWYGKGWKLGRNVEEDDVRIGKFYYILFCVHITITLVYTYIYICFNVNQCPIFRF